MSGPAGTTPDDMEVASSRQTLWRFSEREEATKNQIIVFQHELNENALDASAILNCIDLERNIFGHGPVNMPREIEMSSEEARTPKLQYQDIPELKEIFADSIGKWNFDGNTLRMEFTVARIDRPDDGSGRPIGRSFPACRLVLSPNGAIELLNRCRQLALALEKMGLVKQTPQAAAPPQAS